MSKKIEVIIASFLVCMTAFDLSAQPAQDLVNSMMPKPVPTSPNVAALGKFGDYQVSNFSGLPDISIPIYEVRSGGLMLPITLDYHASGIKPTDVASWVGMGWALSAGGQISRTVAGKPDEQYYSLNALEESPSVCGPSGEGTYYYLQYAARGVTDTEPDIFTYSFPGTRGKFIWTFDDPPYTIPYAPLDISSDAFTNFEIADQNGIRHLFGKNEAGTQFVEATTATNGGNPTFSAITAWHLAEMISPNSNDKIFLNYQDVGSFYTHDISYSYTVTDQCYSSNGAPCPENSFTPQLHNNDSYGNQLGLESITFETGIVRFYLREQGRSDVPSLKALDRIEIQRLDGSVLKTIKFVYTYFSAPGVANAVLKLDALEIKDEAGGLVQRYAFEYFTNSFSWAPGNDQDLRNRDLWGYFNGAANLDLLLPKTIDFTPTTGNMPGTHSFGRGWNRAVNPIYVKEGVLKKITFPTGGYSEFDYESHKYLKEGTVTLAGGLRVTRIESNDDSGGPPVVKTYRYGQGESGYGSPGFTELQFNYSTSQIIIGGCLVVEPYVNYRVRSFFSNSAFNTDPFDSSPILYPYVTEYLGDPSVGTNGRVVYEYDHGAPSPGVNHVVPNSGKYFRNSFFWKRGKLTRRTVYDNSNNKLFEAVFDYSPYQETSKFVGMGVHEFELTACITGTTCQNEAGEWVSPQTFFVMPYQLNSGVLLQTHVAETTFENGDITKYVTNEVSKSYDGVNLQLTQNVKKLSNSPEQVVTVNRYPFQFAGSINGTSTGVAKAIYELNRKNILSLPIETYNYLQKSDGSDQRIVSGQVTTYRQNQQNVDQVVIDQIFLWESSGTSSMSHYVPVSINSSTSTLSMDSRYKCRLDMEDYDEYGNIRQIRKSNDQHLSYLWGYNNSLPVAEIVNAAHKNVFYTSFEDASTNVTMDGKSGDKSGIAGLSTILTNLDPGPYILSYYEKQDGSWVFHQLPITVTSTGEYFINISGQVDEVRFHPAAAQMATYTYDAENGITSSTDANSVVTSFKYDDFMRLRAIKNNNGHVVKTFNYNYRNQN